ncbi:hypothetical protein NXS19_004577 [Fusarium pseudograminearum]|nr:hypothetical protein NXS19_004577 [Fusarium pseudograminearum]
MKNKSDILKPLHRTSFITLITMASELFGTLCIRGASDELAQSFVDSLKLSLNEKAGPDGVALEWGVPERSEPEWHSSTITINTANLTRAQKRNILDIFRMVLNSQRIVPQNYAYLWADPGFVRTLGDPFVTVTMTNTYVAIFQMEFRKLQGAIADLTPAPPLEFVPLEGGNGDFQSEITGDVIIDTLNLSKSDKRKILETFATVFNDNFLQGGSVTFAADPGFLKTIAQTVLAVDFDHSLTPSQMDDLVVLVPDVALALSWGKSLRPRMGMIACWSSRTTTIFMQL